MKQERLNPISVLAMKIVRRIRSRFANWYHRTAFLSGLKSFEEGICVDDEVTLWNDHVSVGANAHFYKGVTLWGPGEIVIGGNTEIGINCVIYASQHVEIGDNTVIAANCYIIDSNHGIAKDKLIREQTSIVKGPVIIGEDVWLGAGVKVLSGVTIGKGAVIGAGAVVNTNIPEYAIAVGVPARVIGHRN